MRTVLCLALAALCATTALAQRPTHRIEVSAPECAYTNVPVTVGIEGVPPEVRSAQLRDGDGRVIPAQFERNGDSEFGGVTFILAALPQGESVAYDLFLSEHSAPVTDQRVEIEREDGDAVVTVNGQFFTRYVTAEGPKPYFFPVIGPTGAPVTRNFPMTDDVEGEAKDHPHHRSFWFTHDRVNGVNFWHEAEDAGRTVNREYDALESGPVYGRMRMATDWVTVDEDKICEDLRDVRIYNVQGARLLDFDIDWRASEGDLELGDTKEGVFGFRVAHTMKVEAGGHILNAVGDADGDAWGKAAEWCDYYGPVDGQTVGITIMDHPDNPGHPTHWHVRTYGLFCANIFGLSYFEQGAGLDGGMTVPEGESLRFRYRVLIHEGTTEDADVAGAYAQYITAPEVTVTTVER